MQATHQNKFDMLRGVASIAVLIPHAAAVFLYRFLGPDHPLALAGGTIARHAVLVFFLLSGFLITLSIVTNVYRNGRLDVAEYLAARIARIYPPLVGAIVIVLVAFAIIHGLGLPGANRYGQPGDLYAVREQFTVKAKDVLLALLMQNGMLDADGPLWSLYIEFHLYIFALFAAIAVTATGVVKRLAAAIVAIVLVAWWIRRDTQFVFYLAVWGLGAALSIWRAQAERFKTIFAALAGAGLAVHLVLLAIAPGMLVVEKPSVWASFGLQFVACIAYMYAIFFASWGQQPTSWLIRSGDYSYSLYVIHFPLLLLVLSLTQTWMGDSLWKAYAVAAVATVGVIATSSAFANFFENQRRFKPHIRNAINFILRTRGRPATT